MDPFDVEYWSRKPGDTMLVGSGLFHLCVAPQAQEASGAIRVTSVSYESEDGLHVAEWATLPSSDIPEGAYYVDDPTSVEEIGYQAGYGVVDTPCSATDDSDNPLRTFFAWSAEWESDAAGVGMGENLIVGYENEDGETGKLRIRHAVVVCEDRDDCARALASLNS